MMLRRRCRENSTKSPVPKDSTCTSHSSVCDNNIRTLSWKFYETYIAKISTASPVPNLEIGDFASDFLDNANALMAEDHSRRDVKDIRMAETAVSDFQENFIWLEGRDFGGELLDTAF
jgi:hypothetical protein